MAPWNIPVLVNSSDKWPAYCQIASSGQGISHSWSAWVPAGLSNKPLTRLKRWHFSSLFIKPPKEHLSWGANRRGTGEKCFSPGFPEPYILDISCFPEQPLKYQKNTIQQNRGPWKADTRCVKAWARQTGMFRRVRIHHNCVQGIIKIICWREIFLITARVQEVKELLIKYPWLTGVAPGIILHFDRLPMLENK